MARSNENEILNQVKVILFDSNIERDLIDYEVKYNPNDTYVHYFIKFKNDDKYIIKGKTVQAFIPKHEAEKALKTLTAFIKLSKNKNLNIESLSIFSDVVSVNGKRLYSQAFIPLKENSNILFFPELNLLYFSKKIKLQGDDVVSQQVRLDFYKENVTPENFELKASELIELIKVPLGELIASLTVE